MIYLINVLLVPLYFFLIGATVRKEYAKRVFFVIVSAHAILFRALADPYVYTDTEGYALAFLRIAEMRFREAVLSVNDYTVWGQGYVAFNWFVAQFSRDPSVLFIVTSVISVGGVMMYYYKVSDMPLATTLVYLLYPMMYITGFHVIRQHLAVVFVLWALYFIDNLKVSIPLIAIGCLFHTTALVFFPFVLFKYISVKKITALRLLMYSIIGLSLGSIGLLDFISGFERYEDAISYVGKQRNIVPVFYLGSMAVFFYMTGVFKRVKSNIDINTVKYLLYGLIIALFCTTLPKAGRLTVYFLYIIPVCIPVMFRNETKKTHNVNIVYTVVLFAAIILGLFITQSDVYSVYRSIIH